MGILLNICYIIVILFTWPYFLIQSWRHGKYREGFRAKFLGDIPESPDNYHRNGIITEPQRLWFHAVSVGEAVLISPLVARLCRGSADHETAENGAVKNRPLDVDVVISTTSQTGQAVARQRYPDRTIFYAPLDFTWAVRRALRRIRPTTLVLVELEIWPNLIRISHLAGVRIVVVNGRISEHSFNGYRRFRWWLRPIFESLDQVCAQDEASAQRFMKLGVPADHVVVTGSLKYDGAQTDRNNPATQRLCRLAGLPPFSAENVTVKNAPIIFMAGSTQPGEDEMAIDIFRKLAPSHPELRLILVPRHPERFAAVWELCRNAGYPALRRSEIRKKNNMDGRKDTEHTSAEHLNVGHSDHPDWRILLVDTVGELSAWWGMAAIAMVGGSFPPGSRGGQNMIEPAGFGAAVCFGTDTRNFRDIVATLLAADAARIIHDATELESFVAGCLDNPESTLELGRRAQEIVLRQQGAVHRTFEHL